MFSFFGITDYLENKERFFLRDTLSSPIFVNYDLYTLSCSAFVIYDWDILPCSIHVSMIKIPCLILSL